MLPTWQDLPEIKLYADQLIEVVTKVLAPVNVNQKMVLTKSMINNYTKKGLLPAPEGKKYTTHHVARLIVLTLLKQVFSLTHIDDKVKDLIQQMDSKEAYNAFIQLFDELWSDLKQGRPLKIVADSMDEMMIRSAISAVLSKMLCEELIENKE